MGNSETLGSKKLRWRYIIDREFQRQFMGRFALIVILVGAVALGMLWLLERNAYSSSLLPGGLLVSLDTGKRYECGPPGDRVQLLKPRQYFNALQLYWKPILFICLVNLALILIFSLFYSHTMAGPIYSIKRSLRDLAAGGEVRPIKLRKGDQFQELADLLNQVIEKRVK